MLCVNVNMAIIISLVSKQNYNKNMKKNIMISKICLLYYLSNIIIHLWYSKKIK